MPSNRRNGQNQQQARRPRVAGLRNREAQPNGQAKNGSATDVADRAAEELEEQSAAGAEATSAAEAGSAEASGEASGGEASAEARSAEAADVEAEPEAGDAKSVETADEAEPVGHSAAEQAETVQVDAVAELPEPEASTEGAADGEAAEPVGTGGEPAKRRPWGLWAATAVLAAVAVWFGAESYAVRYTGPAANETLVDAAATSEANGQITDAVEKIFSYDFNDTAKTEKTAQEVLVGGAVQRYNDLFAVVKQQAPQQQLIVTTTVKSSSVTRLEGNRAELLLFVDQHAMRANTGESNTGPGQISVSAEKQGDRWKITQITLR